jgi:glycolate oxidase
MALSKDLYRALEDIVGPENVTEHPAIIDSYRLARLGESGGSGGHSPGCEVFAAVVLPGDTSEVQAIVRLCNKYRVRFKPSSTGFFLPYCDPGSPGEIKLDLKRMNRIVEINEKSLYAVVEPYVITAELQAELMKRGLNMNVAGCGVNSSAHPFAAHQGIGHTGETTSYRERNILGVEWVTPEGEIVRMGSLGSTGRWFCGDGPGPSLRGIVVGTVTPLGGMGVFTRAGIKVYPWPGAARDKTEGVSPYYLPKEMPENFFYGYYSFPTIEEMCEAQRKIGESEIAFQLMGFNIAMIAANMATSNPEDMRLYAQFREKIQGRGFQVVLAGNSKADFEYKRRVLTQIMDECHGKALEPLEDPRIGAGFIWRCIRVSASVRECFRMRGGKGQGGFVGGTYPFAKEVRMMEKLSRTKERLVREGVFRDDGGGYGAGYIAWSHELGHLGHGEILVNMMDESPKSVAGVNELFAEAYRLAKDTCYGVPGGALGDALHEMMGPYVSNYHLWMRKVKQAFDPNDLADSAHHISSRGPEPGKVQLPYGMTEY